MNTVVGTITKTSGIVIGTYLGFVGSRTVMKIICKSLKNRNIPRCIEPIVLIGVLGTIAFSTCVGGFYGFAVANFIRLPSLIK